MNTSYFMALEQNRRKIKKWGKDKQRGFVDKVYIYILYERSFDEFFAIVKKLFFFSNEKNEKKFLFNRAIWEYAIFEGNEWINLIFLTLNEWLVNTKLSLPYLFKYFTWESWKF